MQTRSAGRQCNAAVPEHSRLPWHRSMAPLLPHESPATATALGGHTRPGPAPRAPPAGALPARFQNHRYPGQRWRPRARHRPAGQWRPRARAHVAGASQSPGARGVAASLPLPGRGAGPGAAAERDRARRRRRDRAGPGQVWGRGGGRVWAEESRRGPDPARAELRAGRRPAGAGRGLCALWCGSGSPALRYATAS